MATSTISISADYLTIVRRYSELSGASAKAAVEHAIDQTLSTQIRDYLRSDDDPEVEQLTKAANVLLPENWSFNVCSFGVHDVENLIGINVGISGLLPTYISQDEALIVRNSLDDLPYLGGSFHFGGNHMGSPVFVRRQGQGILFQLQDISPSTSIGAKTTIARTSVPRIIMALDAIMSAARSLDGTAKQHPPKQG